MKDYKEAYKEWCTSEQFDTGIREELLAIVEDKEEIKERFYKDLEFGTGGLRGIIGAGTNRLNIYTVRKATQGLANFIINEGGADRGVAIAYDSRRMSTEFALETALCFAANGIKTYLFDELRPTPELSFAVRYLKCMAGVVITASHNPPEYNGYKVYWEDGAQITAPKDKQIIAEVNAIQEYSALKTMDKDIAISEGLLTFIGENVDNAYISELKKIVLNESAINAVGKELSIVYTPIHGSGNRPIRRILEELGFSNVFVVPEQELPNGDFPTVSYPNPEDPDVFKLALKLADEVNADIILATDPDADRLGIYAKNSKTGEYIPFTGNMSGALICEYELEQKYRKGLLSDKSAIVKTIVTTNMANAIANEYNVECMETLTGFKYIGEKIKQFEENNSHTFEFGFEESYGCLVGTYARDKDAVVAVMALCEAAAYYKNQGLTLWEQMTNIYEKYGYYKEDLKTITLKGIDGNEKIQEMMRLYRETMPANVGGFEVLSVSDYGNSVQTIVKTGEKLEIDLPKSNVLYYELSENAWYCVRPSGTEPKIKFYFGVKGKSIEEAEELLRTLKCATDITVDA